MCYSGCRYENKNGGCKKPANKICPEKLNEEKEDDPEN